MGANRHRQCQNKIQRKTDILGLTVNLNLSEEDRADGLIDKFVISGRENVKYYEV